MTKGIGRIAIAAALLGLAALAVADDLESVQQKIENAWGKHKSVTSKMSMSGHMGAGAQGGSMSGEGTLEVMHQGDKTLSRIEMKNKVVYGAGDQKMEMEQESTLIVDGEYAYTLAKSMGQTMAMKMDIDPQMTNDPKAMFDQLKKNFNLKLLPDETVNGVKCYAIEATSKDSDAAQQLSKMVLYYDIDNGFIVKTVTFDADGKEMMTMTYSDVKFDVPIDPKRFVFEAPEGVTVMDQSTKGKK